MLTEFEGIFLKAESALGRQYISFLSTIQTPTERYYLAGRPMTTNGSSQEKCFGDV
jgi:hypothetical protein